MSPSQNEFQQPGYESSATSKASDRSTFGIGFFCGLITGAILTAGAGGYFWWTHANNTAATSTAPIASQSPPPRDSTPVSPPTATAPQPENPTSAKAPTATSLNLQQTKQNGTSLRIDRISFSDDAVLLDLNITNSSKQDIELNKVPGL
ncbi:hypothetical protein IQ250_27550, partial [Pseudanabaenaceae cyanobacterium LEGE 13415]|nr:hypothetical protein [Pseudanabaenaceae cyanobacterium LEGE 13415]